MTTHENRLDKTVLMMGHKILFKGVIWKIISKLSLFSLLIWSTADVLTDFRTADSRYHKVEFLISKLNFTESLLRDT